MASSTTASSMPSDPYADVSDNDLHAFCRQEASARTVGVINQLIEPRCRVREAAYTEQLVRDFFIAALVQCSCASDAHDFIIAAQRRGSVSYDVAATNLLIGMLMHCEFKDVVSAYINSPGSLDTLTSISVSGERYDNAIRILEHTEHYQAKENMHRCQAVVYPSCGGSCHGAV